MNNRTQAVDVAKDILSRLPNIGVTSGVYCQFNIASELLYKDAQSHLLEMKNCKVCAIGALAISHVRLYDKATFNDFGLFGSDEIISLRENLASILSETFSKSQLALIEIAFERPSIELHCDDFTYNDWESVFNAASYSYSGTPEQRLSLIMENIVKNDGLFVPELQFLTIEDRQFCYERVERLVDHYDEDYDDFEPDELEDDDFDDDFDFDEECDCPMCVPDEDEEDF